MIENIINSTIAPWLSPQDQLQKAKKFAIGVACYPAYFIVWELSKKALFSIVENSIPVMEKMSLSGKILGGISFGYRTIIVMPALEELLFRQVWQTKILNETIKPLLPPSLSKRWDSWAGVAIRVSIVAPIFGLCHSPQLLRGDFKAETLATFLGATLQGIAYGVLKEKVGFFASFGLHATNNAHAFSLLAHHVFTKA